MGTDLLDAAFRLASHSLQGQDARIRPLTSDEDRLVELQRDHPQADPQVLQEALARAAQLEELAIQLADAYRGVGDGSRGPELTREVLASRCPGFSESSYGWAIEDGFMLTRK